MITSTSNTQIKELAKLQKKSRLRDERGIFLVEGPRMVEEIPKERIERLYISESFERKNPAYIKDLGVSAEVLSDPVFSYVSDTKNPQGILAIVKRLEYTMEDILGKSASKCEEKSGEKEKNPQNHQIRVPHVIVLDNLQDPGNLGTIFRTAEAAGATGILLSSDSVDVYNPKVIRSTMGAVFRMPFFYVKDLPAAVKSLSSQGIRTYAAHLNGKNAYDEEDYTKGCAFLIGNEGNGLRDEVSECADCLIRIPMCGKAESLNAAVAAAVLMFEAGRQRRK
ncbi:TrmH family RNA methyltransferase [[Ruminococcus] lactaris]|uniref:TrmH family RNA methyltransferase n=1 Tax=[Ruminococcus] lactaris TaxID=46228 RepID=UPI00241D67A2|nr:RNA methyltransferase [[Ruminococcus] lactaris]